MKNKQSMKVLATAVLLSSSLALGGQPVQAMENVSDIDIVADATTENETEKTETADAMIENETDSIDGEKSVEDTQKMVSIDETNFPDPKFREIVKNHCDADQDGFLSELEVQNVYELDASGKENDDLCIQNVKGIEYLTRLKSLNLSFNVIEDIDLSKNTDLEELIISHNDLETLDLSNNTKLKKVVCDCNRLSKLDFSNQPDLEYVECFLNNTTDLNVSKNTKLTELSCSWNQLTSLDISNNTALTCLKCDSNRLQRLDATTNTALKYLYCDGNYELTELNISKNTDLIELECGLNKLATLDISNNKLLKKLKCDGNSLTVLDTNQNTELEYLNCWENQINNLDVSNNTKLTCLICGDNKLQSLDVSNNTKLTFLECDKNQLKSLDVRKNVDLKTLYCEENEIQELDVTNNSALCQLVVSNNPLKKIDIRKCPVLINVWQKGECRVGEDKKDTSVFYILDDESCVEVDKGVMVVTEAFLDLEENAWYKDAVVYVQDNAFMNGTSGITFAPNMTLTRAQFVTVLHNIEGGKELPAEEYSDKFTDVPKDAWYTNPVMWALKNGVTSGVAADMFGTDEEITREQLATLLYKYAGTKGDEYSLTKDANALKAYPDVTDVSDWATEAMQWAVSNGVISGKPGEDGKNILNPKGNASRAECAQMIMNFITKTTKF